MLLIVCPLALLAGFVDSIAGGGGLISLPAYYLAGLPPVLAAGTNKLSAALGTLVAAIRYGKAKQVQWLMALVSVAGALPGSALGAMLLQVLPEKTMRIIVIGAVPLVAAIVLRRRDSLNAVKRIPEKWVFPVGFFIGLFIGFYDGLVGPGTGTFLILLYTMIVGIEAVKSSGTAKIVNLASNVAALATLLFNGHVLFLLGLPAALCAMVGGYLGAGLTIKKGTGFIRWMLMAVLALLLAKMIWDVVT
jgi:uncharacterized membrane protein YfcA